MKRIMWTFAVVAALGAGAGSTSAAPIAVDGVIGSEWNGVTPVFVTHDAAAPTSNFGSPGNTTAGASYSVRVRDDGSFYYVALQVTGDAASSAGDFANLYFDTNPQNHDGSDVGFEVINNDYFIAGGNGPFSAAPYLTFAVDSVTHTIELAIDNSFFTSGPRAGLAFPDGYPVATGDVVLRLSQSFGYSVAGGPSYGDDFQRLGAASVVGGGGNGGTGVPLPNSAWAGFILLGGISVAAGAKRLRRQLA